MNVKQELINILEKHDTTIQCAVVKRANWDKEYVTTLNLNMGYSDDDLSIFLSSMNFDPNDFRNVFGIEIDSSIFLNNGSFVSVIDDGEVFWKYNTRELVNNKQRKDNMAKKGIPKQDGSGGGARSNRGRGGCKVTKPTGGGRISK